ncbi:MAG: epoxyqueuosine reductase QueH [Candidatus Omnitrophota bacterium]
MKNVLLHICCGVCAIYSIEQLKAKGFQVTGFFFNPNIYPESEYEKRRQAARLITDESGIRLIEENYDNNLWQDICGKYKSDKEGSRRCCFCYEFRLKRAFEVSRFGNYDYICTTLTISPHKNFKNIIVIGNQIAGDVFLPIDFKKHDGFKKTITKAKEFGIYRQNYCGCIYSRPKRMTNDQIPMTNG